MRDGILESRHTLLVLTEAYLKSGWTEFESLISQTLDPANRKSSVDSNVEREMQTAIGNSVISPASTSTTQMIGTSHGNNYLKRLAHPSHRHPSTVDIRWFFGHRYGDFETFTGRAAELKMLDEWLNNDKDNLLMLRALGRIWQIRVDVAMVQQQR